MAQKLYTYTCLVIFLLYVCNCALNNGIQSIVFINSTSGNISDGLKTDYKPNQRSKWIIVNPNPNKLPFISFRFSEIITECSFDFIMVFAVENHKSKLLATLSGSIDSTSLVKLNVQSSIMLIYFFSDMNYVLPGFHATFHIFSCLNNCNGNGNCIRNRCNCFSGWRGDDCSERTCTRLCLPQQQNCKIESFRKKQCSCVNGFIGINCQMPTDALMWPNTWIMVYRYSEHKGFSTRRAGHAGCYIAPYFYIFGGFGLNTVFNDLLLYDFAGNNWIFSPSDHQPSPRYFHTMNHLNEQENDYLLLYGGNLGNGTYSNEFWIYNITIGSWKMMNKNNVMLPSQLHAAAIVNLEDDKYLYVYGGQKQKETEIFISSDIYRFKWKTRAWEHVAANPDGVSLLFLQRAGHSMVFDHLSRSLVVFGGFHVAGTNKTMKRSRQLLLFDLQTQLWAEITSSNSPKPLAFHSASVIGDYMVIIGGNSHKHKEDESCYSSLMYFYNLRCNSWHKPSVRRSFPTGRFAHVAAVFNETTILIQGGYNGIMLNELYAYKAPLYALKTTDFACFFHDSEGDCLLDQRCWWGEHFCYERPATIEIPSSCPGYCNRWNTCQSCSVFSSYNLEHNEIWEKIPCKWCPQKNTCFNFNDTESLTECKKFVWWGDNATQALNTSQDCIREDPPVGFAIAFYFNDDDLFSPDKIVFSNGELNLRALNSDVVGNHTVVIAGFLHVPPSPHTIEISLRTENGYGKLYLSDTADSQNSELVVENPGNLSRNDADPFYSLPGSPQKRRLYYRIEMTYHQLYKPGWTGHLKLSWTYEHGNFIGGHDSPLKSSSLEPYRSPTSENHCIEYSDCMNCLLDYSCAWWSANGTCVLRDRLSKSKSFLSYRVHPGSGGMGENPFLGLIVHPAACTTCTSISLCSSCTQNILCIWTVPGGCQKRNFVPQGARVFLRGRCPLPCNARTSCRDCLRYDGADDCTWCSNKRRCFNFKHYHLVNMFGECAEWFQDEDQCHECESSTTCRDCVKSFNCGWCSMKSSPFVGSCERGHLAGPEDVGNCHHNRPASKSSYSWSYGYCDVDECTMEWSEGVRLHNCSRHATCVDTPTSYQCVCHRGFVGDGFQCERTCYEECVHGTCSGYPPYECVCELGWTGDDASDVDCNVNCGCNFHSTCLTRVGLCDHCHNNTSGQQCEQCIPEHFGNPLMRRGCEPCFCNGHGDRKRGLCDSSSGNCFCLNNTTGRYCEKCLPGFYGDPRNGGVCYRFCNGRYSSHEPNGAFATWNTSDHYIHCFYFISQPLHSISLTIEKNMDVNCTRNKIFVFNNESLAFDSLLASVCGSSLDEDIVIHSDTGALVVAYQSNKTRRSAGFNATFKTHPCSSSPCVQPSLLLCPGNCSNFGICENGLCRCQGNRVGLDCGQSANNMSGAIAWQLVYDHSRQTNDNTSGSSTPKALFGHTMAARFNELWLFGGFNYNNNLSSNLWRYNIAEEQWRLVASNRQTSPSARYMHALLLSPDSESFYLYGGIVGDGATTNDFWKFQFGNTSAAATGWSQVLSNQTLPAVAAHTLTLCSNSTALLIGGYSFPNNFSSTVWAFNFSTQHWKELKSCGAAFRGVYGHSAVFDSVSDLVYVYGGLSAPDARHNTGMFVYSVLNERWSIVTPVNSDLDPLFTPPFRYFHTAAPYVTNEHRGFIVMGGKADSDTFLNDVWLYRFDCRIWIQLDKRNPSSSGFKKAKNELFPKVGPGSAVAVSSFNQTRESTIFYVFGGNSYGVLQSTLHALHVTSPCKAATSVCSCIRMMAGCTLCRSSYGSDDVCLPGWVDPSQCGLFLNRSGGLTGSRSPGCDAFCQSLPSLNITCGSDGGSDADTCNDNCSKHTKCQSCKGFLGVRNRRYCRWQPHLCVDDKEPMCREEGNSLSAGCRTAIPFKSRYGTRYSPSFRLGPTKYKLRPFFGGRNRAASNRRPCSSLKSCTSCLAAKRGSVVTCAWSADRNKCIASSAYELRCLSGLCGVVIRRSSDLCPLTCRDVTYCRECLKRRWCGWTSVIGANGKGFCRKGNLQGIQVFSSVSGMHETTEWNFLRCPPENECRNDHHDCNSNHRTICEDREEGFACRCQSGYRLSKDDASCKPVCTPACKHGVCTHPDRCRCDFGYHGDRCDQECRCNGNSNCETRDGVEVCTQCLNNTTGDRCQLCEANFVGDPASKISCISCSRICNGRSNRCLDEIESEHRTKTSHAAICLNCSGHSEGRHCETCLDGYFMHQSECVKCTCNGHDAVCDKNSGKCSCKNNTVSSEECDDSSDYYLDCLSRQCNKCATGYRGNPVDGDHCYLEVENGDPQCFHSSLHLGCGVFLSPGHTSFFVLLPRFPNVDIRLFIDVSKGEVDVYISQRLHFKVVTSPLDGIQTVNVSLPSQRKKRAAKFDANGESVTVREMPKNPGSILDQFVTMSSPEPLAVLGVRRRLVVVISYFDYQFNSTAFYVILHVSKPRSLRSRSDNVVGNGGAAGRVIFRQDAINIDLFVFFSVFFSIFFVTLSVCAILWKLKQAFDIRLARLAHHRKLETMASRPFSTVYIGFDQFVFIPPPSERTTKFTVLKSEDSIKQRRRGRTDTSNAVESCNIKCSSSSLDHLPVPMLHTTEYLYPHEHDHDDDFEEDLCLNRIIRTSCGDHQTSSGASSSHQKNSLQIVELSERPAASLNSSSSSKQSDSVVSCSYTPQLKQSVFKEGPIAIECTGDMNAAISTVILQMPVGAQSCCSIVLGSALVSTRHVSNSLKKSRKRKFFQSKL